MTPWPSQRALFDVPAEAGYFNCAYSSPQLNATRDRLLAAAAAKSQPWLRLPADFFADANTLRGLAAQLFGGTAQGWAVVPAASYGLATAARVLEPTLRPGDGILLLADDFPSNVLTWRRSAAASGARLHTVPVPADGDWTAAILGALRPGIRVVAVPSCHWTNGAAVELVAVGAACRAVGAALVVDATQTLGAVPLSVDAVRPDFLVAGGYKWLLGPYGCSLLFVAERWRDARPLEESWLARRGAEDFTALVDYQDDYQPGARRFDVGETCTAALPGAIAALQQIQAWGVDRIAATLSAINARTAATLEGLGFSLVPAHLRMPNILGATLPPGCTLPMVAALRERQLYISQRGASLRFAPHLHINDHDEQRLAQALRELLAGHPRHAPRGDTP